jgi:WD40 repeat protein
MHPRLFRAFFLATALALVGSGNAQPADLSPMLARYPRTVTAMDVSVDGRYMAVGGDNTVTVIDLLDQHILFSGDVAHGLHIDAVKLSADSRLLAALSSEREAITLFDVPAHRTIMSTRLQGIVYIPLEEERLKDLDIRELRDKLERRIEGCAIPGTRNPLKFVDGHLLVFDCFTVAEFCKDADCASVLHIGERDFIRTGFEMEEKDPVEHKYVNLPWFTRLDTVLARRVKHVLYDPSYTYAAIWFFDGEHLRCQLWQVLEGKLLEDRREAFPLDKSIPTSAQTLTHDGRGLLYAKVDSIAKGEHHVRSSLYQRPLWPLGEPVLLTRLPDQFMPNEVVLSENKRSVIVVGSEFENETMMKVQGGSFPKDPTAVVRTRAELYDLESGKRSLVMTNNAELESITISPSVNSAFVTTAAGTFRADLNTGQTALQALDNVTSPKILDIRTTADGRLFVITEFDIREFELTSMRQIGYWPIVHATSVDLDIAARRALVVDGPLLRVVDLVNSSEAGSATYPGSLVAAQWHRPSGEVVTADIDRTMAGTEQSWVRSGPETVLGDPLPSSSRFKYEGTIPMIFSRAVERKKPLSLSGTSALCLKLSPDGLRMLAITSADMGLRFEDLMKLSNPFTRGADGKPNYNDPEILKAWTRAMPGEAKLWRYMPGGWIEERTLYTHDEFNVMKAPAMEFSPDGKYVSIACDTILGVSVWNVANGKRIAVCGGQHGDAFTRRAYSWSTEGSSNGPFTCNYRVTAIGFSPDGSQMVTGANDVGRLNFWRRITDADTAMLAAWKYEDADGVTQNRSVVLNDEISYVYDTTLVNPLGRTVTDITYTPDGKFLFVGSDDGLMTAMDLSKEKPEIILITSLRRSDPGYVVMYSNSGYYANRTGAELIYFVGDSATYPAELFDLGSNRPDVLRGLSTARFSEVDMSDTAAVILEYEKYEEDAAIVKKRMEELVESLLLKEGSMFVLSSIKTSIANEEAIRAHQLTTDEAVDLSVVAESGKDTITAIQVWVNGVPLFGRAGRVLTEPVMAMELVVRVPLSSGVNKIEVAAGNALGFFGRPASLWVDRTTPPATKHLHVLLLAVSNYDHAPVLEHAINDARDVLVCFQREARAQYDKLIVDSLFDGRFNTNDLQGLRSKLMQTGPDDMVVVFYSGHGAQDSLRRFYLGTTSMQMDSLENTAVAYDALEALIDSIPARQKLVLIDACYSGQTERTGTYDPAAPKGGRRRMTRNTDGSYSASSIPVYVRMAQMFPELLRGDGSVSLAASTGYDQAIQLGSVGKGNGAFTLALLEAAAPGKADDPLRADTDHDGAVTVTELQRYLEVAVPRITRSHQTPTLRTGNRMNDFKVFTK